jgi:hypothetical protein
MRPPLFERRALTDDEREEIRDFLDGLVSTAFSTKATWSFAATSSCRRSSR